MPAKEKNNIAKYIVRCYTIPQLNKQAVQQMSKCY